MEQPEGYVQPGSEQLVCKLKRSLYGLKQSLRCWNTTLTEFLESIHFKRRTRSSPSPGRSLLHTPGGIHFHCFPGQYLAHLQKHRTWTGGWRGRSHTASSIKPGTLNQNILISAHLHFLRRVTHPEVVELA